MTNLLLEYKVLLENMTTKFDKLQKYLGDFNDYVYTGICFNGEMECENDWEYQPYKLKELTELCNLPEIEYVCPCGTRIDIHCLLLNIKTNKLVFVGRKCIEHFDGHYKPCIDCHKRNTCRTKRCKDCRKLCDLHNKYHDDNEVHQPPPHDFKILSTKKYKGKSIDSLLGNDDSYIQWLTSIIIDEELKQYIIDNLLMKTEIQFGKHKGKTHEYLYNNRNGYYTWLISNCDKPYIKYLTKNSSS